MSDTPTGPVVDGRSVYISEQPWRNGVDRTLWFDGGEDDTMSFDQASWPILVAALRSLGVIPDPEFSWTDDRVTIVLSASEQAQVYGAVKWDWTQDATHEGQTVRTYRAHCGTRLIATRTVTW